MSEKNEDFRNNLATADKDGKRIFVYPRKPKGKLTNWRNRLSYLQLLFLFAAPFISFQGKPLILLNIFERKFIIFGLTFWPQDFIIFALAMLASFVAIALFTAVYGRVFCGWMCPQTIFLEMLYRKIEYFIDGDYRAQKKLVAMDWNAEKIRKRFIKHSLFILISFFIANVFLAYLVGKEELFKLVTNSPAESPKLFVAVIFCTVAFYWLYSYFREQFCTFLCPYARLQSVLLDNNSIVVAYDEARGEPRGRNKKSKKTKLTAEALLKNGEEALEKEGDCVDCNICVQVCPTGIDIRNGFPQLECINCSACIDACNDVMQKTKREPNLISYTSENKLHGKKFKLTSRIVSYSAILAVFTSAIVYMLVTRSDIDLVLLRARGSLAVKEFPFYKNLYTTTLINKTLKDRRVRLKLSSHEGIIEPDQEIFIKADSSQNFNFWVKLPQGVLSEHKNNIEIQIIEDGKILISKEASFITP